MLGLLAPTRDEWVQAALQNLPALLSDHAHCELKAAHNALSLVARFGAEAPSLVTRLVDLAQEETRHFLQVHEHLRARGVEFQEPASDAYAVELRKLAKNSRGNRAPLLDRLLIAALIEARSAERFALLERHIAEPELQGFYHELLASEAGHYRMFMDMAAEVFGVEAAKNRYRELAEVEAKVVKDLPASPTVHG